MKLRINIAFFSLSVGEGRGGAIILLFAFLFFHSSCNFRDYTNEIKLLDSANVVLTATQMQLQQVDTIVFHSKIQKIKFILDSLKQMDNTGDTLLKELKHKYIRTGKTYAGIVKETRRLHREMVIISGQLQRLKKDLENGAYDEQSVKEYVQSEITSVHRVSISVNKFLKMQAEELEKSKK